MNTQLKICATRNILHLVSGCTFGPLASQMSPVVSEQAENAPVQTSSSVCICLKPAADSDSEPVQIKTAESKCIRK